VTSATPPDPAAALAAAVKVAASLGLPVAAPQILADGANIVIHLAPAPVVAKVAASTAAVRPGGAAGLQRELDLAAFLTAAGAPVMAPSPEVAPEVHHADGQLMSFWTYLLPPSGARPRPTEATIGSMLRDLHAILRTCPGHDPVLTPLADIPAYLTRPQTHLPPGRPEALAAAYSRLTGELTRDPAPLQQLHGDAGGGNLMATERGWVWHDFEDTCSGPVAWDLAASTASQSHDADRVLAAYGEPVDPHQLATCEQLRRLHLTVWYSLYAERLPDLRPRATDLLTQWPAPTS